MLVYVAASGEIAGRVMNDLQTRDMMNCYICPAFVFAYLDCDSDEEMELRLDLLSACERLIVVGEIGNREQTEIEFAQLVKMEVLRFEPDGTLRPLGQ